MTTRLSHTLASTLILLALGLAGPGGAAADAIIGLPGPCPPGMTTGIENHAEVCVHDGCSDGGSCPPQSTCVDYDACYEQREMHDHRGGPYMGDVFTGMCEPNGSCPSGGTCRPWQRCEPSVTTPAWDPAARAWTGEPHIASAPLLDGTGLEGALPPGYDQIGVTCGAACGLASLAIVVVVVVIRVGREKG